MMQLSLICSLAIATMGALFGWLTRNRCSPILKRCIYGLAWWSSLFVAATLLVEGTWWPDELWKRPLGLLLVVVLCSIQFGWPEWLERVRVLLLPVFVVLAAWSAMPRGETWKDLEGVIPYWMLAICAATWLNSFSIGRTISHGGQRWGLWIVVASLAAPLLQAGATYASLAEWMFIATLVTTVYALAASCRIQMDATRGLVVPAMLLAALIIACGSFYTDRPMGVLAYGFMLFYPSVIAGIDGLLNRLRVQRLRMPVAFVVASLACAGVAWMFFSSSTDSQW